MVSYKTIKKLTESKNGLDILIAIECMFKYSTLEEVRELVDAHYIVSPRYEKGIGFRIGKNECVRLSGSHFYISGLDMEQGYFGEFLGNHPEYKPEKE